MCAATYSHADRFETLIEALEDASKADPTLGFRFVSEDGVPGFSAHHTSEASFSFAAVERASARYGGALQALGLKKGERVALILPSAEDFILCFFGAMRAGLVPVPVYPPLGLAQLQGYLDNTRHILGKAGARAVVTTRALKRLLGTVQAACPELEQVVAVEGIRESFEPLRPPILKQEDVAFLQFTSGSTSRPKGVALTHANLMANIACITREGLRMTPDDVGVSWLPLYHDMGLIGFVLAPIVCRTPIVFLPPLLFLKRPATWLQAITRHKATISFGPNFAYALCVKRIRERELEKIDLSTWRIAGCGAEPIRPETLISFAESFGRVGFSKQAILPAYGMAESSLAVAFTEVHGGMRTLSVDSEALWRDGVARAVPADTPNAVRLVSCGTKFAGHELQIFDPSDTESTHPLAENCVGEIRIKGPSVMSCYWEDAERTREAFGGGWLKTGDLGLLHDNHVYLCGRSKEVIIVNGRNYYPQDIEWEASRVDGVRKGNVIAFGTGSGPGPAARAESDRERVVVAFEVQETANALSPVDQAAERQALIAAVRKAVLDGMNLSVDDVVPLAPGVLPKTSSGKLQRGKTRELYESGELRTRKSARATDTVDVLKEAAKSSFSYFKLAVLGGRSRE